MSSIKARLPSTEEALLVFGGCVFIIHVWAVINLLDALPSWILRLDLYELAGVISYPLAFALLESLLVWALMVVAAALLPRPLLRRDFLSQAMVVVLFMAIFSVLMTTYYGTILLYVRFLPILVVLSIVVSLLLSYQVGRLDRGKAFIHTVFQRVIVLSALYVFIDLIGVVVIASRNFLV